MLSFQKYDEMSTPTDLLVAAKRVCDIADSESMYRASINRLYYSAHHQCKLYQAALPRLGSVRNAKGRHEQLINQLAFPDQNLSSAQRDHSVAISKMLRVLCNLRVDSDYHMNIRVSSADLNEAIENVELLFQNT